MQDESLDCTYLHIESLCRVLSTKPSHPAALPQGYSYPSKTYPIEVELQDDDGGGITLQTAVVSTTLAGGALPEVSLEAVVGESEADEVMQKKAKFRLVRTGDMTNAVAVRIYQTGTANRYDYRLRTSGVLQPVGSISQCVMITIPVGQSSALVDLTPLIDAQSADTGTSEDAVFTIVQYPNPFVTTPYTIKTGGEETSIDILDGWGRVSIKALIDSIAEDVNANAWLWAQGLKFELSFWGEGQGQVIQVPVTYSGTAGSADYSANATVNLRLAHSGPSKKSFYVFPVADAAIEQDETVVVSVGSSSNVQPVAGHSDATGTILDDDLRYLVVELSSDTHSESHTAIISGTVRRVGGSNSVETPFQLSFGGNASNMLDYKAWYTVYNSGQPYRIELPSIGAFRFSGTSTWDFEIQIINDSFFEGNEVLTIDARPIDSSQFITQSPAVAAFTIIDDDQGQTTQWTLVDAPANPAFDYKLITTDNGDREWVFNQSTKVWQRIKIVESWMPISSTTPIQTAGDSEKILPTAIGEFYVETSYIYQTQVTVGLDIKYVPISFSGSRSTTQALGQSGTYKYDPRGVSEEIVGTKWASLPLIKVQQFVRQFIYDPQGASRGVNGTPLGLDAHALNGELLVTREELIRLRKPHGVFEFYTESFVVQGDAAVYKNEQ